MNVSRIRSWFGGFAVSLCVVATMLLTSSPTGGADAPAQQKTLLDKEVAGIRTNAPVAADAVIELLQDSASITVTVDWDKLGARGDKGIVVDLKPMPLRDMISEILKAAGAKKKPQMTVEGRAVRVTAAPEQKK